MITSIIDKLIGTKSQRFIKNHQEILNKINKLEDYFNKMSGDEIREYVQDIKKKIANSPHKKNPGLEYLPEIFAITREAATRAIGHRHYDVQMLGGIALYKGYIAEMGTGEGKTLVATLPVVLRSLEGQVHMVTVNDYLAEHGANIMGKVYSYLGISSAFIVEDTPDNEKINIFSSKDIIYISNNQIVFHYLRHLLRPSNKLNNLERKFSQFTALVDEIDNIFIDEARTPFIISSSAEEDVTTLYEQINKLIPLLEENTHFLVMFKSHNVLLTDEGTEALEKLLKENGIIEENLYASENNHILHVVRNLLKAHHLFRKDIEYAVINNPENDETEIVIIDESTGRLSFGRRFSKGLHQALEAKEFLEIQGENQTLLSITYTSFFKQYTHLCGMTGTASTEKEEFWETYKLEIVRIPPNRVKMRIDNDVQLFESREKQLKFTIDLIRKKYEKKQPILVVTTNVQESEVIEYLLNKENIPHQLLNAKHHKQESEFIANAGTAGAITIATNMAGRGTDIKLGGNTDFLIEQMILMSNENNENLEDITQEQKAEEESLGDIKFEEMNLTLSQKKKIKKILEDAKPSQEFVKSVGGLSVIVFGLPESEKILLQAIGRAGRQGDVGESYSLISLDDDILKTGLQGSFNKYIFSKIFDEGEDFVSGATMYNAIVKKLWAMLNAQNFKNRKDLNKYEEIRNQQRNDFFSYRDIILASDSIMDLVNQCFTIFVNEDFNNYSIEYLQKKLNENFHNQNELKTIFKEKLSDYNMDEENMRELMLESLDFIWKKHINEVESIQYGSNLVAYAQKDPFHEFTVQASNTFKNSIATYRLNFLINFFKIFNNDEEVTIDNNSNFEDLFKDFLKNKNTIEDSMKNIEDNPDKEDFQNRLEELLKKLEIKKEELENLEKEKDSPIDNKNPKDSD
jgi:preprotein translocase subunit SecA